MTNTIHSDYATGGAGLTPSPGSSARHPPLATILRAFIDDLVTMKAEEIVSRGAALLVDVTNTRSQLIVLLAKLDDDAGVTDTDYEATHTPAALTAVANLLTSGLVTQLNALRVDLAASRTKIIDLLAQLDLDATVNGTNYAALWTPAALTSPATITDLADAAAMLNALIVDRAALRTAMAGILAKLDLDSGVTDTNYAALCAAAPPTAGSVTVLTNVKG